MKWVVEERNSGDFTTLDEIGEVTTLAEALALIEPDAFGPVTLSTQSTKLGENYVVSDTVGNGWYISPQPWAFVVEVRKLLAEYDQRYSIAVAGHENELGAAGPQASYIRTMRAFITDTRELLKQMEKLT